MSAWVGEPYFEDSPKVPVFADMPCVRGSLGHQRIDRGAKGEWCTRCGLQFRPPSMDADPSRWEPRVVDRPPRKPTPPTAKQPKDRPAGWVRKNTVRLADAEWSMSRGRLPARRQRQAMVLVALHGDVCGYCGVDLTDDSRTIDHVIPKSAGGTDRRLDNLRLACAPCNTAKGNMSAAEFIRKLAAERDILADVNGRPSPAGPPSTGGGAVAARLLREQDVVGSSPVHPT